MVVFDNTSLFSGGSTKYNTFNILIWLLSLITSATMWIHAANTGNNSLETLAGIFFGITLAGPVLIEIGGGDYVKGGSTFGQASFALWIMMALFNFGQIIPLLPDLSGLTANSFLPASQTYGSAAISTVRSSTKDFFVGIFSPTGEDYFFAGAGYLLFLAFNRSLKNALSAALAASVVIGGAFAAIHTTSLVIGFIVSAVIFTGLRMFVVLAVDRDVFETGSKGLIPVNWALFNGTHLSWNISVIGFAAFFSSLFSLSGPLQFLGVAWIIFFAVTFLSAWKYILVDLILSRVV